jgi:glutamine amidotransferase PdxT
VTVGGISTLPALPPGHLIRLDWFLLYKIPSTLLYFEFSGATVMLPRLLQDQKASFPMLITLAGIVILVRLVQDENAELPMLVTLAGIVRLARLVQDQKAEIPILVTLAGIVMLVRPVQDANAEFPIAVTGLPIIVSGITTVPVSVVG